jgi:glycosyltransferase involved in cell wall biosynthesis
LILAGSLDRDPCYTDEIRTRICQQGLEDYIHLLGLRTDIPCLLCASDVFLHTSKREAHPRSIIEAMAAGLPVVAFGVGGVAETVVDRETGYLLPAGDVSGMADAVLSLLKVPAQAAQMGQRGRERVQRRFTAASTAAQVEQIIDELLQ